MKFTFKTDKPTGRYKSFFEAYHHIKLKGEDVGSINSKEPFSIRLMVMKKDILEDKNPNCPWKWITLKAEFKSLDEAKEFLNKNFEAITTKWALAQVS